METLIRLPPLHRWPARGASWAILMRLRGILVRLRAIRFGTPAARSCACHSRPPADSRFGHPTAPKRVLPPLRAHRSARTHRQL
jgi:hypothetical protein